VFGDKVSFNYQNSKFLRVRFRLAYFIMKICSLDDLLSLLRSISIKGLVFVSGKLWKKDGGLDFFSLSVFLTRIECRLF
jgi:hypothetical protein